MITKTVTVDEKAVFDTLLPMLDERYELCYVDYRDELPSKTIQECLDKRSSSPLYEEDYWAESKDYYAKEEIRRLMEKAGFTDDQFSLFQGSDEYWNLVWEIQGRDHSTPVKDTANQTRMHAYLRFHSNYDCWLPLWEQGGIQVEGTALGGILAALSLNPRKVKEAAVRKGVTTIGAFRNIPSREGKELVDYDLFVRVLCETPNYGNWSFFGTLDLARLLEEDFDPDEMLIPNDTTCCMFNWWNGGGSLDFCHTLRPVSVKELRKRLAPYSDGLKIIVDEGRGNGGYTPCEVYGQHLSNEICLTA